MTLTMSHGPLSGSPEPGNYRIVGPAHRLLFDGFPRRVRAVFAGETVLDTTHGALLHETGLLPQLYVPEADVRTDLLSPSAHRTHCPFKGDATYRSLAAGGRMSDNAVWAYEDPHDDATWLRGYRAFYWSAVDAWFDEDEEVTGHLRDPYHRVDVRRTRRLVRIVAGDEVIAETDHAQLLSETGLPNRYYLPIEAVSSGVLEDSGTTTVCPYKGTATYSSARVGGRTIEDAGWAYRDPFDQVRQVAGHICFAHDELIVEVDGEATDQRMPTR
ncbi:MAG: DUF427 domain-containing protein [Tomitella sp.]|nr:DUF427 domain-containing protein [Tomitella sp.]